MTTVLIDNYDSFTWNVYQYFSSLGAKVVVFRNDKVTLEEIEALNPRNIVISPGPGHPATDAGISRDAITHFAGKIPIFGICLGQQCMFEVFGGKVSYAGEIFHGKTSTISHDGKGIFKNVPQNVNVTRYHSLAGVVETVPEPLEVTARTDHGIIMAVRHKEYAIEGVQFHPESILCEHGKTMIQNFLNLKSGKWNEDAQAGVVAPTAEKPAEKPAVNGVKSSVAKPSVLNKIYQQRALDVEAAKATPGQSPEDLRKLLALHVAPPLIDFVARIKQSPLALMAEVKRASPSKGNIDLTANAAEQALKYAQAGAHTISVLTEPKWFKGSLMDMRLVREALASVPNRPAILRKDFVLDTYQILEARLYGADTVLLIVAMLNDSLLQELYNFSKSLGMEPLVEVNNDEEMSRALALGAKVIGVNNRNLHNFDVDMTTTSRLAEMVPEDTVLAALSGITSRKDVETYIEQGVKAVLVGESLMRAEDPHKFVAEILGHEEPLPKQPTETEKSTLVKICGVKTVEAALAAAEAGADFIGMIFAKSKRQVSIEDAKKIITAVREKYSSVQEVQNDNEPLPRDWFTAHARLIEKTAKKPLFVGVFLNQPIGYMSQVASTLNLDLIQLHGTESPDISRYLPVPTIKAFHIDSESFSPMQIPTISQPGYNALALLDAKVPHLGAESQGGQGVTFDWSIARQVVEQGHASNNLPILLAGGLTPENVTEAVVAVRPWAVDVSSGVETDGTKDLEKIKAFVANAKSV
ncbi:hypothetical protein INT43_003245 [Umbelopsis isabellina]|uniref:Multifunctional tryptophan biosynthesis protein n=1 Tax=Mortierella isabellina TaxID=91625 RepID=A0A8H7PPV5_MORIS|nr:hypothetical protein INT43_003245 [Umbelopsis isabellina]